MNLTFVKNGNVWTAEFSATNSFNLHIERNGIGDISLYQKTSGNNYGYVEGFDVLRHQNVVDVDFVGGIFPKSIKVISATQPTMAVVTFAE
jgi:hypothetical protein